MKEERCKYCNRKVVFLIDSEGKRQILDLVSPVYEVDGADKFGTPEGSGVTHCSRHRGAFVSHFVTCPKRDEVKRTQAGGGRQGAS